jgi:CRP-like cAMP-binding protein
MTTAKMLQMAPPFQLGVWPQGDRLFQWVEELAELVRYARGAWIHSGHEAPDAIYLIRGGRVGISVGEEGAILGAGELFGELFFSTEELRGSYLARALEESEVWVVRRERVLELLEGRPDLLVQLKGMVAYKQDLLLLFHE